MEVNAKEFANDLKTLGNYFGDNALNNYLFKSDGDKLMIAAGDYSARMMLFSNKDLQQQLKCLVPRTLRKLFELLPNEVYQVEYNNGILNIQNLDGTKKYKINTIQADNYPDISRGELEWTRTIGAQALKMSLSKVIWATETTSRGKYVLTTYANVIMIRFGEDYLQTTATNSKVAIRYTRQINRGTAGEVQLNATDVYKLIDFLGDYIGDVIVNKYTGAVEVRAGERVIICLTTQIQYVDINSIMPQVNIEISMPVKGLLDYLRAYQIAVTEGGFTRPLILFEIGNNEIKFSSKCYDDGDNEFGLSINYNGESITICLNYLYLIQMLKYCVEGEQIVLRIKDYQTPIIIHYDNDNRDNFILLQTVDYTKL